MTTTQTTNGSGHAAPSEILDRMPPCDPTAERCVLSSILLDPSRFEDASDLRPSDFYEDRNQRIFSQLVELRNGGAIDSTLLVAKLQESGDLELAGGMAYLSEVIEAAAVPSHCGHYSKIVKDMALKRGMIQAATETLRLAYAGQGTAKELLSEQRAAIERLEGSAPAAARFSMKAIAAAELDASDYEVNYLVDGVLVEGQPCIVGGKQKTLKTSLLAALAVALVLARKFLGVFNVPRACRVGFVSCESGLGVLQETLRRVCIAYGCALSDLSGLVVSDTIPRLDDPACIAALESFCTDHELNVLILDPAYLMMSGADAGNLLVMGERLAALNRIASNAGVTIILAHHCKKGRAVDGDRHAPPQLEEIAWSGFAEFARQWLLLGRRSEYEDGSGQHDLWMRAGGSAGHSGLWGIDVSEGLRSDPGGRHWDVEVRAAGDIIQEKTTERANRKNERQREDDEAGQRAIVEALSTLPQGEGVFPRRLYEETGIGTRRLGRLLAQLVGQGIAEHCQALASPTHKKARDGAYRLTEAWHEA